MSQLIISLLVTLHANAMQVKGDPSVPNSKVFCLANMHIDIHNNIAQILMRDDEFEEEFIARTKIEKKVSKSYYSFLLLDGCYALSSNDVLTAFCPDETKIAILRTYKKEYHVQICPKLMIIDLQNKNDNDKVVIEERVKFLEYQCILDYQCIALSPGGNMIASFHKKKVLGRDGENVCITPFLEIQKINVEKNEEGGFGTITLGQKRELLPLSFSPTWIVFNKQGTHLIAHTSSWDGTNRYKNFPLKIIDVNKPQIVVDEENKLQNYFRDKRVCKSIKGVQ